MKFAIIIREGAGFVDVLGTEFAAGLSDDMTFTPQPTVEETEVFRNINEFTRVRHYNHLRINIFESVEAANRHIKTRISEHALNSKKWKEYLDENKAFPYEYKAILFENLDDVIERELLSEDDNE